MSLTSKYCCPQSAPPPPPDTQPPAPPGSSSTKYTVSVSVSVGTILCIW